jgi:hypothetical protein
MKNKVAKNAAAKRIKLAKMLLYSGILLVVISALMSVFFIQPTDFKQRFKKQQLQDCLATSTPAQECQNKFD